MPPPKRTPKTPPKQPPPGGGRKEKRTPKTFSIQPWTGEGEGERFVIYSPSGMGKTTLASLAPNPVFVGVDPGGRKMRQGGEPLSYLPVEGYQDLRDALAQPGLFSAGQTLVIDTATRVESDWTIPHILATVPNDKGAKISYIERYGYGKGFQFVLDHTRYLLSDLDRVASQGVHVLLLCQEAAITVPNAEGLDFLQNGPKLCHTKQASCRQEVTEWADHVLRIGYHETEVTGVEDARVGKVATDDNTRVIYSRDARHFVAKSRVLIDRDSLPEIVAFESPEDDSLWRLLFG